MNIIWHGLGSFSISGKPLSGEVTVVTDPYDNETGLRFPRTLKAAVVVSSHEGPQAANVGAVAGMDHAAPFEISHAGEYEVQGVFVTGIRAPKKDGTEHTIFRIGMEGMQVGFLGALDRLLTDEELEKLGTIDVLIVPVGGGDVLAKDDAQEVVNQVEPRLVVPSYYDTAGLKKAYASVEPFCKELACPREDAAKLKLTRSSLPEDEIRVAVLARA